MIMDHIKPSFSTQAFRKQSWAVASGPLMLGMPLLDVVMPSGSLDE